MRSKRISLFHFSLLLYASLVVKHSCETFNRADGLETPCEWSNGDLFENAVWEATYRAGTGEYSGSPPSGLPSSVTGPPTLFLGRGIGATWTTTIVFPTTELRRVLFDLDQNSAQLLIDDVVQGDLTNLVTFPAGSRKVTIVMENWWHTTQFSVSFNAPTTVYSSRDVANQLQNDFAGPSARLFVAGCYDPLYGVDSKAQVEVKFPPDVIADPSSTVLVLFAFRTIHWKISSSITKPFARIILAGSWHYTSSVRYNNPAVVSQFSSGTNKCADPFWGKFSHGSSCACFPFLSSGDGWPTPEKVISSYTFPTVINFSDTFATDSGLVWEDPSKLMQGSSGAGGSPVTFGGGEGIVTGSPFETDGDAKTNNSDDDEDNGETTTFLYVVLLGFGGILLAGSIVVVGCFACRSRKARGEPFPRQSAEPQPPPSQQLPKPVAVVVEEEGVTHLAAAPSGQQEHPPLPPFPGVVLQHPPNQYKPPVDKDGVHHLPPPPRYEEFA